MMKEGMASSFIEPMQALKVRDLPEGNCFPLGGAGRRFLSGDLDFTSLDQERNSIPNELIKLETLPRGGLHGGLLRHSENATEGASRKQILKNYGKRFFGGESWKILKTSPE